MRSCVLLVCVVCLGCEPETAAPGDATSGAAETAPMTGSGEASPPEPSTTTDPGALTEGATSSTDTTGSAGPGCSEIAFADGLLEKQVRDTLGLPEGPITPDAALNLVALAPFAVRSLAGLECFPNLQEITIRSSDVSDLGPLAGLDRLTLLHITRSQVSDLSPLSGLPRLQHLYLAESRFTSLAPLAGLPLRTLEIEHNTIDDLSPLAGLTTLEALTLTVTETPDLGPLAGLGALTKLSIAGCHVSDLGPLAGLTSLTSLDMDYNALVDPGPLAGLTALRRLDLSYNAIVDVTPLAGLTALEELILHNNAIVDVQGLGDLPRLWYLNIGGNELVDITPLAGLPKLGHLEVWGNPLGAGLDAFQAHPSLYEVDLGGTWLTAIPLFAPASLRVLKVGSNAIADVGPLAAYERLDYAGLKHNLITTLAPLVDDPWLSPCDVIDALGNPLAMQDLEEVVPTLCAFPLVVLGTGFGCLSCDP